VWVHGSELFSYSLRFLSENDTSFYVLGFGMEHWVLCNAYGTGAVTLKWDMGILLTKVTHGVCDPKELRVTTSSGNVLCLGSGLSNTRLFAGRPRHQGRSQKMASPRSGLPIQPTPGKIRIQKTMKRQKGTYAFYISFSDSFSVHEMSLQQKGTYAPPQDKTRGLNIHDGK
jgi:hypothetical protein